MPEKLLERKIKIIRILYKLALKFKKVILKSDPEITGFYISRREKILNELNRIDAELEKLFLINKKNMKNMENLIIKINLLYGELIKIEKENEILLNKTLESKKGNYIEIYKKFNK